MQLDHIESPTYNTVMLCTPYRRESELLSVYNRKIKDVNADGQEVDDRAEGGETWSGLGGIHVTHVAALELQQCRQIL